MIINESDDDEYDDKREVEYMKKEIFYFQALQYLNTKNIYVELLKKNKIMNIHYT